MTIGLVIFIAVILVGLGAGVYLRRMGRQSAADSDDTRPALAVFANAYPDITVRDVVQTEDRSHAFLRLADGRIGLVQTAENEPVATILRPSDIRLETAEHDRKLRLRMAAPNLRDGIFTFATEAETAEVSLWLVSGSIPPQASN